MKCELCKQEINETEERYVQQIDWNRKEKVKERWFHLKCWNNFHKEKINQELGGKVKQVMNMMGAVQ